MNASEAAKLLRERLAIGNAHAHTTAPIQLTIADASAKSGLALRDAEQGLHQLVSEYRGHLRVTEEGELVFRFPHGFTKPWETRTKIQAFLERSGRALVGIGRFVVRAWISIVLIAYALIFLAMLIGLVFFRAGNDSRDQRSDIGFGAGYVIFRLVSEALFWTFHPFSPFAIAYEPAWDDRYRTRQSRRAKKDETPFYERVNRFFFGVDEPPPEPGEMERRVLAEIRAQKGRVRLGDVMRVTGLPREEADPLMARLMLDYEGTVEVSDEGGIFYRFEALRKTADTRAAPRQPEPIWARMKRLTPLTGNSFGTNFLIVALNGFNLLMSLYAMDLGLTFERLRLLAYGVPWNKLPAADGTPIALGLVPLVFSIALFALPLGRALYRPLKQRRVARENARRAMLREILGSASQGGVSDEALAEAYRGAAGHDPSAEEISREVASYGGDAEISDEGKVRYRFPDLEAEAAALEAERAAASEEEARLGRVIFTSER